MSDRATLVQFYIAFYNRAPDPAGLTFWQQACDTGLALSNIADLFVPQDESIGTYPFLGNPSEEGIRSFLQAVYKNLFNRDLDVAGETFWTNQILKSLSSEPGGLSIGEVVLSIITGAQGDDITTLANKTTVALDFHDQAVMLDDYVQSPAATTASRLALGVVDETDFSVVQGEVLNSNFFEEFDGQGNPLFTPFEPGLFDPLILPGETGLNEVPGNGILLGNQLSSDVAVLADGKVVTAYSITGDGPNKVAFSLRNADGILSTPDQFLLSAEALAAGDITNAPVITALPDGSFIISVRAFLSGQEGSIIAFPFDSTGQPSGDPMEIVEADTLESIDGFDVTYLPTGNLLYTIDGDPVLDGNFGGPHDAFRIVVTPDGVTVANLDVINDNDGGPSNEDESAAAALPDGTTLVVFQTDDEGFDGDEDAIVGQLYSAAGQHLGNPFVINEFVTNSQANPAVTALGANRFIVVFETNSGAFGGQNSEISAVVLNRDGSVDVDEFLVNDLVSGVQSAPEVTQLSNGTFVVVWRSSENGGDIRARIFEEDGTPVTNTDIVVNTATLGAQTRPEVTATQDGFVVTWDTNTPTLDDPFGFSIRTAAFDEDGVRTSLPDQPNPSLAALQAEEFQVNDQVEGVQSLPSVVGLSDGRSVFSYFDGESGDTLFEFRTPDGARLSDEMVAFGSGSGTRDLEMFATPDGGFVMVGDAQFNGLVGGGILMQIFDENLNPGNIIRVNQLGNPGSVELPQVTVDAAGNIIVGWTLEIGVADPVMSLRKFDADGTPADGEVTVTSALAPGLDLRALTVGSDGTIMALAETRDATLGGTSGDDIFMALLDEDLDPIVRKLLPVDHLGGQTAPAAAPLADGKFLVVIDNTSAPGDASGSGISGIIIDNNGMPMPPVGGEFLINVTTDGNQRTPDVTVMSDGRVLVTWAGENFVPNGGQDIWGRIYNTDGTAATGEFVVNDLNDGNQTLPDVSAAGDGFVAAWLNDPTFSGLNPADVNGAIFDGTRDRVETPLVLSDTTTSFLSEDDFLNLQDIPLSGGGFFIDSFAAQTSLGAELDSLPGNIVRYNPLTAFWEAGTLPDGDQMTDIFTYTVENAAGDQVTLIGSAQVQAFEDISP